MKSAKEYRAEAREALSGNWGAAIVSYLLFYLCYSASSMLCGIGQFILYGVLVTGLSAFFIQVIREKTGDIGKVFSGFSSGFANSMVMGMLNMLFVMLWSLLFVIPGIIASFSYAMAPYILADHPEMSGLEAIRESKKLMKGKKGKLFCLQLSFFGWILLCVLTCGILIFWVEPWMLASNAAFYESIKGELECEKAAAAAAEAALKQIGSGEQIYTAPAESPEEQQAEAPAENETNGDGPESL